MTTSIAVIGSGFVGGNLQTVFAERGINVYAFDKAGKRGVGVNLRQFLSTTHMLEVVERDPTFSGVIFVCLPSPMLATGECDTTIIEGALRELASMPGHRIAVVKSTVPPGTCAQWNAMFGKTLSVFHSPEFLKEATALEDSRSQSGRIVIGAPSPCTVANYSKVKSVFQEAFPNIPIIQTDSTTSEMTKYVANCFLACKVVFANEMWEICQKANIDYAKMIEIAKLDKRLGDSHWQVPGPMPCDATGKPAFGFGGSCFSKDINGLAHFARKLGLVSMMLETAWKKNKLLRPQQDWKKLEGRAVSNRQTNILQRTINTTLFTLAQRTKPILNTILGGN